ncbi:MAG: hypothetical protein FWD90_01925 [Defluviitaleaceae bacterium]|nr:hypothetical protein [Defluviitaleaceae bacterium]
MTVKIELFDRCFIIKEGHFTVNNGFITKSTGEAVVNYGDVLAVEFVKRRSKKVMYMSLICCGLMVLGMDYYKHLPTTIPIAVVAVVGILCFTFLFSVRRFLEITTMKGIFRVPISKHDDSIKTLVLQLRKHIAFLSN